MKVISFHQEIKLLEDLIDDTILLIHHTEVVSAIKKLVSAHDILELTLKLERDFEEYKHQPPWDESASQELDIIRSDLLVQHANSFTPTVLLPRYYRKVGSLLKTMSLRV